MGNYRTGTSNYRGGIKTYFKKQAADLTVNNSETYVDTDLVTPTLTIGKSYAITGYFNMISATTPDHKLKNVVTDLVAVQPFWTMNSSSQAMPVTALATEITTMSGSGADKIFIYVASIIDVTTAGTFKLQFAQNVAEASNTIFRKGSYWIIQEI